MKKAGFTLIDMIFALTFIGVAIFGLMTLFQGTVSNALTTDRSLQATQLARERLERIVFDKKMFGYNYANVSNYPLSESFTGPFTPFTRTIAIQEVRADNFAVAQANSGYKRVSVTVSWGAGRQVLLETLVTKWNE